MKHIGKTFVTKTGDKEELIVVSLQAHVNNVKSLAEAWADDFMPAPNHHDKLIEAARYHDEAKQFGWTVDSFSKRVGPPERHAWRGAELYRHEKGKDTDVYVYWLIKLHHSFKAEHIAEAMADIKEHSNADYHHFSRDLYLLITCDWFDSGMLNYLAKADQQAQPREPHPFEEFVLYKEEGRNAFGLEPNPLKKSITLSLEYSRLPKAQFTDTREFNKMLKDGSWQIEQYEIKGRVR